MADDSPIARHLAGLREGCPARIYPGQGYENGVCGGNRALIVAPLDPPGAILIGNVVLQKKQLLDMIEWLNSPECR